MHLEELVLTQFLVERPSRFGLTHFLVLLGLLNRLVWVLDGVPAEEVVIDLATRLTKGDPRERSS